MFYFAYGSNMSTPRLQRRIDAVKIGKGKLSKYQLRFHKLSQKDGTGKCDIVRAQDSNDCVWGVVYALDDNDKLELDRIEGRGHGYEVRVVEIEIDGKIIQADTYVAITTEETLKPYDWYVMHVLRGAEENAFEQEYIEMIKRVPTIVDVDTQRNKDELSVYE